MRFDMWKSKAQKGAFLVFTALMIPIIFLCAGFAVDLGNAWAYKSKLQNAADAAALAGAKEYGDNGTETVDSHDSADAQAEKFLIANLGSDYYYNHLKKLADEGKGKIKYQMKPLTQKDSTKSYYRVYLSTQAPAFFMRMFNYTHLDVGVEAVAVVPTKSEGTIDFDNLIDVGTRLEDGQFNQDNGRDDDEGMSHNKIKGCVFDGTVVYRNHEEWEKARYNTVTKDHYEYWPVYKHWTTVEETGKYRFFTPEAKGEIRSDAVTNNHYQWPIEENHVDYDNRARNIEAALEALYKNHADEIQEDEPFHGQVYVPLSYSQKHYYVIDSNATHELNPTIHLLNFGSSYDSNSQGTIPTKINGQDFYVNDSPVYVYIKGNYQNINIQLDEDIIHPIVICYLGESGNIHFQSQKHSFIGTIYFPNIRFDPFGFEGRTFVGSITANILPLHSHSTYYKFWNFGIPSNGNSGGTSSSSDLRLVISDNEGLTWSDD